MTTNKPTLDDILKTNAQYFANVDIQVGNLPNDKALIERSKDQIKALMLNIVGEDERTYLHGKEVFNDDKVDFDFDKDDVREIMVFIQDNGKNILKAKLRAAIKNL